MRVSIKVAIIVIGFSIIFSTFINLEVILVLCHIIPKSYFDYPSKMSGLERSIIHVVVKLVIPIIISSLFTNN